MTDLWPSEIGPVTDVKVPVSILKEQASLLGNKTKNIVEAEIIPKYIESDDSEEENEFIYFFYLVAPVLDNYRYKLFAIRHKIELYPLRIYPDEDILNELLRDVPDEIQPFIRPQFVAAEDEKEFLTYLRHIFGAKKTIRIINSLIAQAQGL